MNLPRDKRALCDREILICQIAGTIAGAFLAKSTWQTSESDAGFVDRCVEVARLIVERVERS